VSHEHHFTSLSNYFPTRDGPVGATQRDVTMNRTEHDICRAFNIGTHEFEVRSGYHLSLNQAEQFWPRGRDLDAYQPMRTDAVKAAIARLKIRGWACRNINRRRSRPRSGVAR
jgi:hypothetical protein